MPTDGERHLEVHIGDGAYAYVSNYRSLVFYTSNGIRETNRVEIDVGDINRFTEWLAPAMELAQGEPDAD